MAQSATMPLQQVIQKVQSMVHDNNARRIVRNEKYSIHSVTWEDCARNKGSVWGPCISDMTLQVGNSRMPVIREDNFTDTTWDVEIDKIPIVVGNEKTQESNNNNNNNNKLETISLKEYLKNFDQYMTVKPTTKSNNNNNNNNNNVGFPLNSVSLFDDNLNDEQQSINLLRKDESQDSHVIVSSQACFLPIEKNKETLFNVALFNYQSSNKNPAILAIVATSKGTSSQIIEGKDQKLLFNKNGTKADFIGQRLTDNRIERGVKDLNAPMTVEEKQDNCIVIIQVPLKQQNNFSSFYSYSNNNNNSLFNDNLESNDLLGSYFGGAPQMQQMQQMQMQTNSMNSMLSMSMSSSSSSMKNSKKKQRAKKSEDANVESAIVKIAPKTRPVCKCGSELEKLQLQFCYNNYGKPVSSMTNISCDGCSKQIMSGNSDNEKKTTIVWHCKKEKQVWQHKNGYDLCVDCAQKQLKFDELNDLGRIIERDERYPIRVTLQYYKSTDNGVINDSIMKAISKQLKTSRKQSDFVGSLVTEYNSERPTEWLKYQPFKINNQLSVNKNYSLVRDVLYNLDLSNYFDNFLNNEICDSRLVLLEESDLKLLFNRLGPLVVFRQWLRDYKNINQKNGDNNNNNNNNNNNDDQKVDFGMGLFVSKD